jgi:hypothetical protein
MKLPFRSVPICAYPPAAELAPASDSNSTPSSSPEHEMVESAGAILTDKRGRIGRRDCVSAPALHRGARRIPLGAKVDERGRVVRPEELEGVDDGQILHLQNGMPVVHPEVDGAVVDIERPEEA